MENLWEGVGMPWAVDSHTITKSYSNPIFSQHALLSARAEMQLQHLPAEQPPPRRGGGGEAIRLPRRRVLNE